MAVVSFTITLNDSLMKVLLPFPDILSSPASSRSHFGLLMSKNKRQRKRLLYWLIYPDCQGEIELLFKMREKRSMFGM